MHMEFIRAHGVQLFCGNAPILLRGFGLGNWLLPEGYMWKFYTKCDRPRRIENLIQELCGQEFSEVFWKEYIDTYITEEDIQLIAKHGFNSVRLPLNARHLMGENLDGSVYLQVALLNVVDKLINYCKKFGIYVILDIHAAPGGQTGQNIDDSEADCPELFLQTKYQDQLTTLWQLLAQRYKDEPAVAGYDLLNEPLPNFFSKHNELLAPLYNRIIQAIRLVDKKHLIILEGAHWATDFSVFDNWLPLDHEKNILLQFHKYWSPPDQESLAVFLTYRNRMNLPIFMGEGGENNIEWYAAIFPLYEKLDISWSFWTYKKMDCTNSPISFVVPDGWDIILSYLDGGKKPSVEEALKIFNSFLVAIQTPQINQSVLNALRRQAPLLIPAEFYDIGESALPRLPGATFRQGDPLSIMFADGRINETPDYQRYGGEPQPESDNLWVLLRSQENATYIFFTEAVGEWKIALKIHGNGEIRVACGNRQYVFVSNKQHGEMIEWSLPLPQGKQLLNICCIKGQVILDTIEILVIK